MKEKKKPVTLKKSFEYSVLEKAMIRQDAQKAITKGRTLPKLER